MVQFSCPVQPGKSMKTAKCTKKKKKKKKKKMMHGPLHVQIKNENVVETHGITELHKNSTLGWCKHLLVSSESLLGRARRALASLQIL